MMAAICNYLSESSSLSPFLSISPYISPSLSLSLSLSLCVSFRLTGCGISNEGYVYLTLILMLNPSCVKELDVSNNHPGESAQKLLSATLKDPDRKAESLQYVLCKNRTL